MAGVVAAEYLGYVRAEEMEAELSVLDNALDGLRQGMFAPKNRGKEIAKTEEGIDISKNLLLHGFVGDDGGWREDIVFLVFELQHKPAHLATMNAFSGIVVDKGDVLCAL